MPNLLSGGPVTVTLNATAAQLLARLAVEFGDADGQNVLVRALGLFEMAARARARGARLLLRQPSGEEADVAF